MVFVLITSASYLIKLITYWKKKWFKRKHDREQLISNLKLDWKKTQPFFICNMQAYSVSELKIAFTKRTSNEAWRHPLLQKVGLCKTVTENWDSKRHLTVGPVSSGQHKINRPQHTTWVFSISRRSLIHIFPLKTVYLLASVQGNSKS